MKKKNWSSKSSQVNSKTSSGFSPKCYFFVRVTLSRFSQNIQNEVFADVGYKKMSALIIVTLDIMYCKAVKGVLSSSFICFWTTILHFCIFKCIVNKGRFRESFWKYLTEKQNGYTWGGVVAMRELTVVKIIIPFSFATFLCYCPHFKISRVYKRKVYYLIALSRMIFAAMFC